MLTTSVPTYPLADEPSPYAIFQVSPEIDLNDELLLSLKMVCEVILPCACTFIDSSVDQTHLD